jgi:peptide/nickel transport system substrate-binding protein
VSRARTGAFIPVVVLLVAAASCGSGPASRSNSGSHEVQRHGPALVGADGGTVTVAMEQVPTTLNDHTVSGDTPTTRMIASAIWPQVFQVGPGQTPVLDTQVVQSAELVSVDPQTVVYQIDPHATWSDGVPITADDFVYSWDSQKGGGADVDGTPDSVASTLGYRDITSVSSSNGGRTVTVAFKTPFGDWASLFDDLLPAHVAARVGWNHGFDKFDASTLVSGGPWMVSAWQPGVSLVLRRNPHWWGTAPHLDEIDFETAADGGALLRDLRSGGAQVGYPSAFSPSLMAALTSSQALETTESLGTTMLQLVFNTKHAPFDNAFVRQGVAHTIDRAGIVSKLVQPVDPSTWEDNDHLFANVQPQYTDDASGYTEPDLAAAARALSQGGLVPDANGTWTLHGSPVAITLAWAQDDPWSAVVEPALAAQLVAGGFDVSVEPVTSLQLSGSVLPSGDFDLALVPVTTSAYPSATAAYYSPAAGLNTPGTNLDWSGLSDPHLDALLTDASQQLGSNLANPLYQQADVELWAQMPTLPLFAEPTLMVNSAWVGGVRDDSGGLGPMFSASLWYRLVESHKKSTTP